MNIRNGRLLCIAQYAAPYEGNFIASLEALEAILCKEYKCEVAYVFPRLASSQAWIHKFMLEHRIFFTCNDVRHSYTELEKIREEYMPTLVHTHFDGYDLAVNKVFFNGVKIVWHMHNHLSYVNHPLKAIYQMWCFLQHYGWQSKNVNIISVSDEMKKFVEKWRKRSIYGTLFAGGGKIQFIPNGIELSRVLNKRKPRISDDKFIFLAFGGRNSQKRIDVLLEAGKELIKLRNDFQVFITKGTDTESVVNNYFQGNLPSWVILKDQTEDIASLFNSVDCFISSSEHETFSYAICEASVFGLPVIQSDIAGTMWNAKNPSTRLFKVNDPLALCKQMNFIIDADKEELEKQIQVTIENNRRDYSLEQWAHNVISFYKQI
jgi:glycosyltransferase involved in cell wall biosynthesis